jgi:hypothetical protein
MIDPRRLGVLTAAGRLLAGHGERIAAQLRQAERDLAELTGQASGPVPRIALLANKLREPHKREFNQLIASITSLVL